MAHQDTGRWHNLYALKAWLVRRRVQLAEMPWCELCQARGVPRLASVVDHIEPHRGDRNKFLLGPLQSLCKDCHDQDKKRFELRGYSGDVDEQGYALDPKHPSNQARPYE